MFKISFLYALFILWAGLILGVSFIATPVKFMAPHLTVPVALEIGKVTFHLFNKIEWGICLFVVLITANIRGSYFKWFFTGMLLIILILQTFWLLPTLDVRVAQVISGGPSIPGPLHWFYIGADILKIMIALMGAYWITYQVKDERRSYY